MPPEVAAGAAVARVTVLGCGGSTGVPAIGGADGSGDWGACDPAEPRNRRTRASVVVGLSGGERLLIDTGPDLRTQLLACSIGRVDAILFTHAHADHVCGIDDVRSLNRVIDRPLEVFATAATMTELQSRFSYAFRPWSPPGFFRPVLTGTLLEPGRTARVLGADLVVFSQKHGRQQTLGFRAGWFAYSTDLSALDDAALDALAGVDTWMVDCFQRQPHPAHAHLSRVLDWARALGVRRTVLTHMGTDLDWAWLVRHLPPGVEPAFDGQALLPPG